MGGTISAWLAGFSLGILLVLAFQIGRLSKRAVAISRIEGKLNRLLKNAGIDYDPYEDITDDVAKALQAGDKMLAIKLHRRSTYCSLSEAMQFIEEVQRRKAPGK